MVGQLAPVSEEPVGEEGSEKLGKKKASPFRELILHRLPQFFQKRPRDGDLRVLLSVLGCPLSPVDLPPLPRAPPSPEVSSRAQYILRQFRATTGSAGVAGKVKSVYASGKLKMATVSDEHRPAAGGACYEGCFVLWQMVPGMWLAEFVVAGRKVTAGSDGVVAWRRTPWLRTHAAPGGARPLRRFLQGLDPALVAASFSAGEFIGEEQVEGEECFVLKLAADDRTLSQRSNGATEIIKHYMLGYFSQRSGLLVCLEDSQITRLQQLGLPPVYWETATRSYLGDYRPVDGVMVAHAGRSAVTMARVGAGGIARVGITEMEETWVIDDVAFDVRGLSAESFILPEEIRGS
ncbi:unnamed protein product [Spirodela intermedia]|uniref:Uncharacterized protein n=1 Tax=Spirodela intermedia TaxID=51605 RepID=A0A7I8JW56_SPIIN|nr:unnamed protein product [Spirodela intermedia]